MKHPRQSRMHAHTRRHVTPVPDSLLLLPQNTLILSHYKRRSVSPESLGVLRGVSVGGRLGRGGWGRWRIDGWIGGKGWLVGLGGPRKSFTATSPRGAGGKDVSVIGGVPSGLNELLATAATEAVQDAGHQHSHHFVTHQCFPPY
ncbi:hypothetical protein E2C01_062033 [Portunus trituberculatus]|uniref:Uncharacterized protein n=1 Tax=Portunus trituberculatus TaxID=210409 RepID=A0A5B7HEU3_PORTR|nr:hypothetical protein [Portunus trituberculatus]